MNTQVEAGLYLLALTSKYSLFIHVDIHMYKLPEAGKELLTGAMPVSTTLVCGHLRPHLDPCWSRRSHWSCPSPAKAMQVFFKTNTHTYTPLLRSENTCLYSSLVMVSVENSRGPLTKGAIVARSCKRACSR